MEHVHDYLIVGAGMAADAAAKAIREADTAADLVMVGEESVPPYQRPPLSKALWRGDKRLAEIDLDTAASGAQCTPGDTSWHWIVRRMSCATLRATATVTAACCSPPAPRRDGCRSRVATA